jgi:hypothetical protein
MRLVLCFFVLFSGIISCPTFAQSDTTISGFIPNYIEIAGLYASDARTPFWLQANQFGTVPRQAPALSLRGGLQHSWQLGSSNPSDRSWRFTLGTEAVANAGTTTQTILLPQAFGAIQYGNWEFFAGRRKQWVGLGDSTLGSGSYAWSGNALPVPKVQLGLVRYTPVPFTKGWISVLGFYSDGFFEKNRPVTSNLKLHQKQLYARFGRPGGRLKLYGGFNHQVQWGGKSPYETVNGQMPDSFQDYLRLIVGKPSRGALDSSVTFFDNANRVGNHLGSLDIGFEIEGSEANWLFYRQNPYEDGSLFRLTSIRDGLNGIRVRFRNTDPVSFRVRDVLLELLYTKNQGGSLFIFNQAIFGRDNYFNHAQVRDGWSYYDRTVGTPFITPTSETRWKFPNYGDAFTSNNRVWVVHSGLNGTWGKTQWLTKLSYSSNIGVYDQEFPQTVYQFSGLLSVQTPTPWLGGTFLKGSLAADVGGLYRNSYGLMLSVRKEILFQSNR